MKTTDERIDELEQGIAELRAQLREACELLRGTQLTPGWYKHQLMCGYMARLASPEDEPFAWKDAWDDVEECYQEGVKRGIYPKEEGTS